MSGKSMGKQSWQVRNITRPRRIELKEKPQVVKKHRSWKEESKNGIRVCNDPDCYKKPIFGFRDHPRSRCNKHRLLGMVRGDLCKRCFHIAMFRSDKGTNDETDHYCSLHYQRKKITTVIR